MKEAKIMKKKQINPSVYFFVAILFLELTIKVIFCKHFINLGLLYTNIFSLPLAIIFGMICKLSKEKVNTILLFIVSIIITIYFEFQYIFYTLFSVPFSFSTISLANQALDFTNIIKDTIVNHFLPFFILLVPLIILIIFRKKINLQKYNKYQTITSFSIFIIAYLSTFLFLIPGKNLSSSAYKLYFNIDDSLSIIDNFGLLSYTKIDLKRQLFGYTNVLINEDSNFTQDEPSDNTESSVKDYGYNILNLNLDDATANNEIKTLNNYIKNKEASKKNQYTGMFKGKNIIFILAEGFNEIAVDKDRTPTLYNLIHTGFEFENFYSPVFLSTTGGEFQATTGLIPTQETLSLWKSKLPNIKYALGNSFSLLGYQVQSYHDWTYTYYKRNKTMPTLGFNNYLGCGNGLEQRMNCKWLPSDIDLVKQSTGDYLLSENNFATYYVTVSGHSPYNNSDNIAKKYLDNLSETTYSDPVKYYLAAQMELDKMVEELINELKENNKLDDTVIALVGDHYPYTLSTEQMNEVSSYEKDGTIEVNHSNFILWNNQMEEPVSVTKVGSQIDVLPTLLNLFGIEYDSRLIIGQDILSDTAGIAIFSNRSWVTDYGSYDSQTRKFTLKEGQTLENQSEYINTINNRVANAFSLSKMIIKNDYYTYITKNRGE